MAFVLPKMTYIQNLGHLPSQILLISWRYNYRGWNIAVKKKKKKNVMVYNYHLKKKDMLMGTKLEPLFYDLKEIM